MYVYQNIQILWQVLSKYQCEFQKISKQNCLLVLIINWKSYYWCIINWPFDCPLHDLIISKPFEHGSDYKSVNCINKKDSNGPKLFNHVDSFFKKFFKESHIGLCIRHLNIFFQHIEYNIANYTDDMSYTSILDLTMAAETCSNRHLTHFIALVSDVSWCFHGV